MSAARETAAARMNRVLAEVLWISERDGPSRDEVCTRFGVTPEVLEADLQLAALIGADSDDYLDMPIEVVADDDRVFVHLHEFDRPLRLTPAEALTLVVSGAALTSIGGADSSLGRALDKIAAVLGIEVGQQVDVDLGVRDPEVLQSLRRAVDDHRAVEIAHLRAGTDERTRRTVEPWELFHDREAWYLAGYCRRAEAERTFRVDRIVAATVTDEEVGPPPAGPRTALRVDADAPRLVLDLDPEARWVVESHPVERVEDAGAGRSRVTLAVVSRAWTERLLLRLGPHARVVAADPALGGDDLAATAARRILARYGSGPGPL